LEIGVGSVFPVSLLRTDIVQRYYVQRVEPLNIVLPIRDQHDAAANGDEIRMLHGNAAPA
jgi:hypothetical protein